MACEGYNPGVSSRWGWNRTGYRSERPFSESGFLRYVADCLPDSAPLGRKLVPLKPSIQKLFAGIVVVIVLAFILLRGDQLVELADTMKRGAVVPLVLAVLTQLGKYYAQSWAYHFTFASVDEEMNPRDTLPLVFGTFFMNTIAPSLNMAGATLVVDDARQRGIAGGKAMSAALLMQITIESGFMTIMIVGFIILQVTGNLSPAWFLTGLVVVALVGFMGGIMLVGRKSPQMLINLLHPIERLVNKVIGVFNKPPLEPWAEKAVASFGDAAGTIARNPKTAAKAFGCSIAASTCELSAFCLVGISFNIVDPEALICGYVIATLLAMISPVPQGVGFVEAGVMVLFSAYSINSAAGMASVLVYRGLVFWMPFLIGAVLIQRTKSFKRDGKKKEKQDLATNYVTVPAGSVAAGGTAGMEDDAADTRNASDAQTPSEASNMQETHGAEVLSDAQASSDRGGASDECEAPVVTAEGADADHHADEGSQTRV